MVQRPIAFLAMEAGSAAWMAPLWMSMEKPCLVFLSPVAHAHVTRLNMAPTNVTVVENEILPQRWRALEAALAIVSATGRAIEADAVASARTRGTTTMQAIDTWGPYSPRFTGDTWPDCIVVVDRAAQEEAVADGLPDKAVVIGGHPAWECCENLPEGAVDTVAFIGQPIAAKFGDKLGFDERSAWRALLGAAEESKGAFRNFVYLAHPEEDHFPHVKHSDIRRDGNAVLKEAGHVVGMYSSLMIDALLGGRSVISLQPNGKEPDPCPLSRHGRIARVVEPHRICEALAQAPVGVAALKRDLAGSRRRVMTLIDSLAN